MAQNFTLNNKLVTYLNNQCNIFDKALVEAELEQNNSFNNYYYELKEGFDLLNNQKIELKSPSTASVELIEMIGSLNLNANSIAKS